MSQNNFGYFFKKKMFSRTFKNRPIWVHWLRSKKFCSIDRRTSPATDCLTSSSRRPRLAFVTFHTTAPFMSSSTTIGRERRHCHLLSMPTSRSSRQKRRHRDLRHSDGVWNQLSEFFWFLCWHCHTACHSTPPHTHTPIPYIVQGGGILLLCYCMICVVALPFLILSGRVRTDQLLCSQTHGSIK